VREKQVDIVQERTEGDSPEPVDLVDELETAVREAKIAVGEEKEHSVARWTAFAKNALLKMKSVTIRTRAAPTSTASVWEERIARKSALVYHGRFILKRKRVFLIVT
jgi:hypothetical protein